MKITIFKIYLLPLFLIPFFGAEVSAQDAWTDRVSVFGDFRFRHEHIIEEETAPADDTVTQRGRIRVRLGVEGKVNDEVKAVFKLSTSGGRTSYNQTLTDSGEKKDIFLDWAYADWTPNEETSVLIGKFGLPFETVSGSQMIFDADFSPEGLAASHETTLGNITLESHLASFWMVERTAGSGGATTDKDSGLFGAQIGAHTGVGRGNLSVYLSDYYFTNFKGQAVIDSKGNSELPAGIYAHDYNLVNLGIKYSTKIGDLPVEGFADLVQNTAISDDNEGRLLGFSLGKVKARGDWSFGYSWREVEADAVLAGLSDSDFSGGITDTKGHTSAVVYGIGQGTNLGLTYFMSELGLDISRDYNRLHLDLNIKF